MKRRGDPFDAFILGQKLYRSEVRGFGKVKGRWSPVFICVYIIEKERR